VSLSEVYCSCIECNVLNAWIVGVLVVGGIYSPQPPNNRWGRQLSMGAPDSPVRQPRHPTVRVLEHLTVGTLTSCGTGQSGAASDSYCALSGAPLTSAAHCSALFNESTAFAVDRCAG
jgi:hypothetical protein